MEIISLLKQMEKMEASDLHLIIDSPPVYRVSQEMAPFGNQLLSAAEVANLSFSMVNEKQRKAFEEEKELDFAYEVENSRFRVNLHYERGNVGCAIRRIPKHVPARDQLHLPPVIDKFCEERKGLILVTGPTGSGKSTTQACMIDKINTSRACHIITIEDPIEYIHRHKKAIIEQREVGIDTFSFSSALKRVLRQDPDVILVGEMRDLETVQIALTAAETGHLVISTLHTPDAPQSIDRIIDVFPPHQQAQIRLQLSLALRAVVAQQLIPAKSGKGVVPAIEIMVANAAVRNIIRKSTTQELYSMIEIGKEHGMQSMDSVLLDLFKNGLIEKDEALNRAFNAEQMQRRL
ncbi:type IV pili twitching motility protein PilT [candidate division WOR-1 bacterium RIFOXYA12_FULL_43_27]|uniref:Type IV pili twitching motility protein PilT n=1 Tax=candidate division WOR-1 bacterium RIFOXYC2_FULL_46_14 TaxID=1802587 RepID=A0A1F4U6N1_UNCSA|nr:MAG: type IV pili twitching motility protein PilT [candidate division WOR-1 bacterium RIFOXYA12_FULL_43_27]OGC19559.1 MAG: type IV pili twitching motility protein PilT [candidate division WOR-1 bacterium RIFOXYB2_FULL_46_45]OGC30547.1 MAG: type IV pili twitching motility protein PilT [candidate division WOR-1 bacterium RIFOXYA2_FULL_46_56]OGC40614.1 MAG: type IV pili twitching motility protein PilT [candidate division WOR-1 bacterium RIFOXYC2_FULL_46_14]